MRKPLVIDALINTRDDGVRRWAESMGSDFRRAWAETDKGWVLVAIGMHLAARSAKTFHVVDDLMTAQGYVIDLDAVGSGDPDRLVLHLANPTRTNGELVRRIRAAVDIDALLAELRLD